eukprot:m.192381 g.192381  ORF g.192381 m.192381 type:complete len:195 (+) comp14854_c0_seq3:5119-5703(+)
MMLWRGSGRRDFSLAEAEVDVPEAVVVTDQVAEVEPEAVAVAEAQPESAAATVPLTVALVKAMLKRESELRLAPETQQEYSKGGLAHVADVTDALQHKVAAEFGFEPTSVGVEVIRCAETLFPEDPEIKDISFYRKYNKCTVGKYKLGDVVADVPLLTMDSLTPSTVQGCFDAIEDEAVGVASPPCVIITGSYT